MNRKPHRKNPARHRSAIQGQPAASTLLLITPDDAVLRAMGRFLPEFEIVRCTNAVEGAEAFALRPEIRFVVTDGSTSAKGLPEPLQGMDAVHIVLTKSERPGGTGEGGSNSDVFRYLRKPLKKADLRQALTDGSLLAAEKRSNGELRAELADLKSRLQGQATSGRQTLKRKPEAQKELNQFRDELMTTASHEIRSPLAVMVGNANLLLKKETGLSEAGRATLMQLRATGSRLLTICNDILDFAALKDGKTSLELTPCRLSELIDAASDNLAGMMEEKQIRFFVEVSGNRRKYDLDAVKAQRMLQNLISNGIKFNRPGGTLVVVCRGEPGLVTFEVRDSGEGLAESEKHQLFGRFTRFSNPGETSTGLGLAIAKSLVELHGGRIWAESARGHGSTFFFTLVPGGPSHQVPPGP